MGLRGPGAKPLKQVVDQREKADPWPIVVTGKTIAQKVISFIECLPITSGTLAGQPFKLRPWQKKIVKGIYRTDKNGKRIVRQVLITLPRKNGKTELASVLAIAHLCGPAAETRGQVYSAAADHKQAALIYDEMKAIILTVPTLAKRIIIRDFTKHLEDSITGTSYFALSSDAKTKHGFSASFIIYDELAQAPDRQLYDVLTTSTGARTSPLTIVISTQSPDEHSIMCELVNYGQSILDGEHKDDSFYPVIYAAPEDADPWSVKVWRKCNPALGDFRSLDEMRGAAQQAQRIPAREATFRLLYLNQRINAESAFISLSEWDACAGEVNPEQLKNRVCYAGLDLASTTDIAALVLVFPGEPFVVLPYFFIPQDKMEEHIKRDHVPYDLWVKQDFVKTTPGNLIDYRWIMLTLGQCRLDYQLKMLAFDRWGSQKLVPDLCNDLGFTVDAKEHQMRNQPLLVQFGQGFSAMSPPTKELLNLILGRKVAHGNNPVLRWMAKNVIVQQDAAGNIKPDKAKSVMKIDGIVAMIMGLSLALQFGGKPGSVYEERAKAGESLVRSV